ncbi:putative Transcriptional regulator [uncultured spirochete]|jgi:AcrR family transcriptional regulator|uniref:Putative Transcriptional regulator n=1 Tax=uncultured spirochete TaxID=156406 RepID=A0A3P3XMJ8_9SPIR|nr:putative Transcriptional regulator [uncultured spirochete]
MNSDTRQALIDSAVTLFSTKWYGTVSVAEICRSAGLSNGAFYRHFKNKEEIFCAILDHVVQQIEKALKPLSSMELSQRLPNFVSIIYNFSQDYTPLVRVFREGQYRLFEYERKLKDVYEHAFQVVFGRTPSITEYLFALAGLRFASIRAALHQIPVQTDALVTILSKGLFKTQPINADRIFATSITPLPIELWPDSRDLLLAEGRKLFGEKGYFETNIHDVTSNAGLAIGSFYRYFESKESFYKEVIRSVGRDVRHFISLNLGNGLNRVEREMRGLWLFILFLSMDRYCYNIVREAEFVLPNEVRDYYDAFHRGYLKREDASLTCDSTTCIEFMLGVAHYLGIEVIFDKSPEIARQTIEEMGQLYIHGLGEMQRPDESASVR